MTLEVENYGKYFQDLFIREFENRQPNNEGNDPNQKPNKRKNDHAGSESDEINLLQGALPELIPNASQFAVYNAVRQLVLEIKNKKHAIKHIKTKKLDSDNAESKTCSLSDRNLDEHENGENVEKETGTLKLPLIVGAGIRSLFDIITETKSEHPTLCQKALTAIFNIIQGQNPESFKSEPNDIFLALFDLLLELATANESSSVTERTEYIPLSDIACSTLLALCVAKGDTGKLLKAVTSTIITRKLSLHQRIHLPQILIKLQRSVQAVILGKLTKPNFFTCGIPHDALVDEFEIEEFNLDAQVITSQPCIASDGKFLYILAGKLLLKIGTGFNGTTKGHVYFLNREFSKDKCGWIGFCNGTLYYKRASKRNNDLILIVDTDSLTVKGAVQISLPHRKENCLLFSDGESVNSISSTSDDTLTVKQIYSTSCFTFDLNLRLTKKGFRTLGYANFEEELLTETQVQEIQASYNQFVPTAPNDVDIAGILCGKEFGIAQSTDGKTFYYGKACSLGLKSVGRNPYLKLNELIISKISKTVQIALGHEGLHALFLNEDGNVYFAGCARRGEDGETSKNRRQIKSVKPKKIAKLDGQTVIDISCNNGTSCFVTKTGKLIMFGKDTSYCDSFGFISDLDEQHITKTSLGKAHCVALNIRGEVFTFGLNNKSQCGRVFTSKNNETNDDESSDQKRGKKYHEVINEGDGDSFSPDYQKKLEGAVVKGTEAKALPNHYQSSCVHASPNCYTCTVKEKSSMRSEKDVSTSSDADRDTPRIVSLPPAKLTLPSSNPVVQVSCGLHHTVLLTLTGEIFTFGSNAYGQLGTGDLQPVQTPVQVRIKGKPIQVAAGSNHTVILTATGNVYTFGKYHKGQLGRLPNEMTFNRHDTAQTGQLFSQNIVLTGQKFFWNCHPGEVFGIGPDHGKKASWIGASGDQTFIKMDESLVNAAMLSKFNVAADKNTILLIPNTPAAIKCIAINRKDGSCRAHANDQFYFTNTEIERQHEGVFEPGTSSRYSEISSSSSEHSKTGTSPGRTYSELGRYLDHNRFIPTMAFTIDNYYDVLYAFNFATKKVMCFNVILAGIPPASENTAQFKSLFVPDIALTTKHDLSVTRYNSALNILACLDILSSAQGAIPSCFESESKDTKDASQCENDEYNKICRFENFGGGWGYSGNSVEAIRFMCDTDILIAGFGMYGGRGEYTCKIKLYDLGVDGGGGFEKDGTLICETDEVSYECAARNKQNIMLPKPTPIFAGKWYLITARISGPSSDCGSSGQTTITTEDQVMFTFKPSKKSNNGTDVHSGQIPSILYRVVTQENKQQPSKNSDPVCKISKNFSNTLSAECFESLICLLKWSWNSLKITINETAETKKFRINRVSTNILVYLCKVCLRLLRKYTNEIYPNHGFNNDETSQTKAKFGNDIPSTSNNKEKPWPVTKAGHTKATAKITNALSDMSLMETTTPISGKKNNSENIMIAECIGDVRALLIHILCDDLQFYNTNLSTEIMQIMEECDVTFIQCFNAFYPTQLLKWNCLCNLLHEMDKGQLHPRLLSVVIAGLCDPSVNLKKTFSILSPPLEQKAKSMISPSDNFGFPMLMSAENYQYPVLVEQMIFKTQKEKSDFVAKTWNFNEVFLRLFDIISRPIRNKIDELSSNPESEGNFSDTTSNKNIVYGQLINNCCHLISKVLSEIVYQTCSGDSEAYTTTANILHSTGSRFAKFDSNKTWNTGNFGSDAIAFTVDRPGISIAGVSVYSGSGSYEYQLELLYDCSEFQTQSQHKWEVLSSVSGTYDQDIVKNDMAELKFDRPIPIKEFVRYAIRLCSQGARTSSGDCGYISLRGPCGVTFKFYPCDMSFNGTTISRGQIPALLYYSTPYLNDRTMTKCNRESYAKSVALQIATDIIKRCTELLINVRNALALCTLLSDKGSNSSNNLKTLDSEHNITPIEEHFDISWTNNGDDFNTNIPGSSSLSAKHITRRIENFSKGIMETFKLDRRITNPFEFEIDVGAKEISPNDVIVEDINNEKVKKAQASQINGNLKQSPKNKYDEKKGNAVIDAEINANQIVQNRVINLFSVEDTSLFYILLPQVFAYIGRLVVSDPKTSVDILNLIREILPHVSALNQIYYFNQDDEPGPSYIVSRVTEIQPELCTTSKFYCVVESDHPYKSATVSNYSVEFPSCVKWMTLEFDPQSGTGQVEDCLLISIPNEKGADKNVASTIANNNKKGERLSKEKTKSSAAVNNDNNVAGKRQPTDNYITVKKLNSGHQWPTQAIILPGNRIEFSLQTASNYLKDNKANRYGFKCLVIGYEDINQSKISKFCLAHLEHELAYLGGMCSATLMKNDNIYTDDVYDDYGDAEQVLQKHTELLSNGLFATGGLETINNIFDSHLLVGEQSYEKQFLKDFIDVVPESAGARLAAWLQPESRLDPNKCLLKISQEPLRNGWPTQLIIETRDQYGEPVYVPDIKIEIRTVFGNDVNPHDARKLPQLSYGDLYTSDIFLPTKKKYRTTVKDKEKSYLKAITAMKCYSDYSFEELRLFSFLEKKNSEVIRAVDCGDLRYSGSWTPSATGNYCLSLIIDDIVAEEVYKVEVIDCGIDPPLQKTTLKKVQPQNRLRKFMAKNSAGLRIRLHPTLQSEQVGVLKVNGIISFTDELENDDGLWLRLTTESIREHCSPNWFPSEAWCLQYNQHLDKTLLFPIIEADPLNIFESSNADSQGFSDGLNEPDLQLGPVVSAKSQSTYNDAKDSVVTEEKLMPVEFKDQSMDAKQWQTHQKKGSQSNIGATIAGVVGEGAIKLQALQKWFKGDRGEGHEGIRQEYRRSESDAGIETGVQLIRNERSHSLFDEFKDESHATPFKTSKTKLDKQAEDFARAFLKVTADLKDQATDESIPLQRDAGTTKILKRALSPSIAETLRTVFAAFLWHEGLIHDAMACASFLKFHPNISKDFSVLENIAEAEVLTREQKAQQRHSLEIASAEAYLNMRPATLEALTKSGNCCVHNRKRRSVRTTIDETGTGAGLREKLTREILPPALKGLVYMWDQLCCNFIQLAETSTTDGKEKVRMKGSSEEKRNENRTYQRNKKDDGSWCELCDIFLPIPVTYHMRIVHPGCGKSSSGKGYNSIGSYCEGWAGNCGEGGQGASSWYLMCDNCREKYSLNGKKNLDFNHMSSNSLQLSYNSTLIRSELFQIMKENSLFLLELNTSNKNFPNRSKSRASGMFTIKERSYHQHEIGDDYLDYISDASFDNVSVKAAKMAVTSTFDSIWCPPDSLSCLETLGGKFGSDLPYNNFFDLNGIGDVEYDRTIFNETNGDQFEQTHHMTQHNLPSANKFHRSFSVEQGWLSQTATLQNLCRKPGEEDLGQSGVVMRRKKNCTCGKNACDSVLLRHPSVHLKRLVPESVLLPNGSASIKLIESSDVRNIDDSVNEDDILAANSLLLRPSMLFILEVHDLKKLKCLMKKKVQKTIGSIYSLQALNWIIRSVTQTISLHDLMWWFVTALKSGSIQSHEGNHIHFGEEEQALEHPVSSNQIGGNICDVQSQSLHNLLQTIAELTLMLPSGSALQKISIQCFGLKFKASDHQFLHRCHVFANISKILSKSEEQNEENSMASVNFLASGVQQNEPSNVALTNLQDITDVFEVTVSSRPAMVNSLIDNSTETFWESDEEDRNKPKLIEASQIKSNYVCKVVSVFIDNSRDISTRVTSMFVYGGQSLREMNFITTIDVDAVECAWIPIRIEDESLTHFRLEFRGSENTLRVRQIKLLGYDIKNNRNPGDPKATNSSYIQQQNCEVETLRVFRMLTNQVFGKLIVKSPGNGNLLATPRSRELSTVISPSAESLDLREHMVGILFSRSKLTHLQRQIIVHIVHAIQKESQRIREEWEAKVILVSTTTDSPEREKNDSSEGDNYIFELLSMVLALSGSGVGKSYLSHQHGLLRDLLTLLHTGSDRIQRQVTALFRRILSEITPEGFGLILGITKVPQTDYGIINENSEDFDMHKLGIIDIFLAVIAKSLQIQLKTQTKMHSKTKVITTVKLCHYHLVDGTEYRSKHSVDTTTKSKDTTLTSDTELLNPRMVATIYSDLYQSSSSCQESFPDQYDQVDDKSRDDLAQIELKRIEEVNNFTNRWFMKGMIANKQAENMIHFFKDMINGKFGERWSLVSKAAIAECIINLTRLDEQCRLPENCVKTPTIWLALASLCVLDKDHVKRLSSSQWSKTLETRPMCTNHDDGVTPAIIECGTCGSLCGDCDRFLHLNRRTRSHYRTLCKEEEEAISVELHENCGRTKLFWLLALADSKTLKGMVEFRDGHSNILGGTSDTVGRCRFCGTTGSTGLLAVGNVCAEQQCQEYAAEACNKILSCGHFCNGIANEEKCLCLHSKCQRTSSGKQNEPKLTQDGDDMCMICFTEALSAQPSIQLNCGHVFHYRCCKQVLVKRWHGARITFGFAQCAICKSDIAHDALNDILEPIMGLKNDVKRKALMRLHYEGIKDASSKDMAQFAMDKYAYYMCSQCDKAYYGGEVRCDQELGEKYDPKELVCGGCSDVSRAQICPKHGTDYLEYKCRYCCSVAIFFCFGTTHFCDVCHDDFQKLTNIPKNKLPQCPVGPKAKKLQGDECPLHVVHPPTGEEFALGCGICRNAQNF